MRDRIVRARSIPSRVSRVALWAVAAVAAVAVGTTAVVTATGTSGRRVMTEDGVADALAAAGASGGSDPVAAPVDPSAPSDSSVRDAGETVVKAQEADDKLLQTSVADIVVACADDLLLVRSVAPKPGHEVLMTSVRVRAIRRPAKDSYSLRTMKGSLSLWGSPIEGLGLLFRAESSEADVKVDISCVDGEPVAKESQIIRAEGAGKG